MNLLTYFARLVFFTLVCFLMDLSGAAKITLDSELFASVHPEADQFVRSQSAPPLNEDKVKAAKKKAANKKKKDKDKEKRKKQAEGKTAGGAGSAAVARTGAESETPTLSGSPSPAASPKHASPAPFKSAAHGLPGSIAQIKPLAKPIATKPGEKKGSQAHVIETPKRPATASPLSHRYGRRTPHTPLSPHKGGRLSAQQQELENKLFAPIDEIDVNTLMQNLHEALRTDEKQALTILSENKPDTVQKIIHMKDMNGWMAIHYAVFNNRVSALAKLVTLGADINNITDNGKQDNEFGHQTPLFMAAKSGSLSLVKYLVLIAPDIAKQPKPVFVYKSYDRTMDIIIGLFQASTLDSEQKHSDALMRRQNEVLKFLIEQSATSDTKDRSSHLHFAAFTNRIDLVQFLLSRGFSIDDALVKTDADDNDNDNDNKDWEGSTPLYLAALNGHEAMVKTFVTDHKAAFDKQNTAGRTPLMAALDKGHEDIANFLIDRGADVTRCSHDGMSTIHRAASNRGLRKITERLLRVFWEKKIPMPKDKHGFTPIHDAAKDNATDVMELFIQAKCKLDEPIKAESKDFEENEEGYTPLLVAVDNGALDVVKILLRPELLEAKKLDVNDKTSENYTALLAAFNNNYPEIAQCLLAAGADITVVYMNGCNALHYMAQYDSFVELLAATLDKHPDWNVPDKTGYLPLHYAAQKNACKNIAILAKKTNLNTPIKATEEALKDTKNEAKTALMIAAEAGALEAVTMLLDSKDCAINHTMSDGGTALCGALYKKEKKVVDLLIQRKADIGFATKKGTTALHIVARTNDTDLAEKLIRTGLSRTSKTVKGATPLHIAARWDSVGVLKLLCADSISIDKPAQSQDTKDLLLGRTPLMTAAQFGSCDAMRYLISRGAQVNYTTKNGFYPLYLAAEYGKVDAARILLEAKDGAKIDLLTKTGYTALDIAAYNGQTAIINLFVEHLGKLNKKTAAEMLSTLWAEEKNPKTHQTPLMLAALNNKPAVVKLLLETKIDTKACDKNSGYNALHIAAENGFDNIVDMLLDTDQTLRDRETFEGATALDLACTNGHLLVISKLFGKYQASLNQEHGGNIPLTASIQSKKRGDSIKLLLALGADSNQALRRGFYPIHIAAQHNDVKAATLLHEHKAVLTSRTPHGVQAIHTAARHGSIDMLEFLCSKTISIDEPVASGDHKCSSFSPLMMAVAHGKINTVRWLLDHKANVQYATPAKTTALHVACQKGFVTIVTLLCSYGADDQTKNSDGHTPLTMTPGDKRKLVEDAIIKGIALFKARSAGVTDSQEHKTLVKKELKDPKTQKDTGRGDAKQLSQALQSHDDDGQDDTKETSISPILGYLSDKAKANLEELDTKIAAKITETIIQLLKDDSGLHGHIKKLTDRKNLYRIKIGKNNPRIIYYKDPDTGKISIVDIEKRSKAYRTY